MKNIASIHITARKWFDKVNGNTYHRTLVNIVKDSGEIDTLDSGFTYGYGEQWNQTALDIFLKDYIKTRDSLRTPYLTSFCKDNNIPCVASVTDVSRRKDL